MKSNKPCFYYNEGRCKYGSECYYQHIDPEPIEGITCFLIRHGESLYNQRLQECVKKYGHQAPTTPIGRDSFQLDPSLIDAGLTEEGLRQAEQTQKKVSGEIEVVFVSPLERALITADIIFKSRKSVQVIVIPELTEVVSKVCDIASSISDKQKRYPYMDFGLLTARSLDWQAQFLDESMTKHIDRCLTKDRERSEELLAEYYLNLMKECFPDSIQRRQDCSRRVKKILKQLKNKCKKRYKNIAIVAHRRVLREITVSRTNPIGYAFDNCQVKQIII